MAARGTAKNVVAAVAAVAGMALGSEALSSFVAAVVTLIARLGR